MPEGDHVHFWFTHPGTNNMKVMQSIDNVTWVDSDITTPPYEQTGKLAIGVGHLVAGEKYFFKLIIMDGKYQGESNIISKQL